MITGNVQSINTAVDVHVGCTIRETLTKSRKNSSKMNNIVDFVFSNYLFIALSISHIELLIAARKVNLLIADICSNNIFLSNNFAESINEGNTNLSLAAGNKDFSTMLYKSMLLMNLLGGIFTYECMRELTLGKGDCCSC